MPFVESPPPRLLIGEELAKEGGLGESFPRDRHRSPVSFEEEERALSTFQLALELEAKAPIRFHAQAIGLAVSADLDLPSERKAHPPGFFRSPREYLFRLDELHAFAVSAGDLKSHHDLGDRERVVKEDAGEVPVLRVPPDSAPPQGVFGLEDLGTSVPKGVDERFGTANVPVELHRRTVEIAMVEEELEAPEHRLRTPSGEGHEVRRAKQPMPIDSTKKVEVARREGHAAYRSALEARSANLRVGHRR
jgi:hypothetical protein